MEARVQEGAKGGGEKGKVLKEGGKEGRREGGSVRTRRNAGGRKKMREGGKEGGGRVAPFTWKIGLVTSRPLGLYWALGVQSVKGLSRSSFSCEWVGKGREGG